MYVKRFNEFPTYTDPGAENQVCHDVLDQGVGEAKHLQIGDCAITGPGQVAEDAHATWSQYFVVIEGKGTLFYDGKPVAVEKDMVIEIPKHTKHYVRCERGESIRYIFINIHD